MLLLFEQVIQVQTKSGSSPNYYKDKVVQNCFFYCGSITQNILNRFQWNFAQKLLIQYTWDYHRPISIVISFPFQDGSPFGDVGKFNRKILTIIKMIRWLFVCLSVYVSITQKLLSPLISIKFCTKIAYIPATVIFRPISFSISLFILRWQPF